MSDRRPAWMDEPEVLREQLWLDRERRLQEDEDADARRENGNYAIHDEYEEAA